MAVVVSLMKKRYLKETETDKDRVTERGLVNNLYNQWVKKLKRLYKQIGNTFLLKSFVIQIFLIKLLL